MYKQACKNNMYVDRQLLKMEIESCLSFNILNNPLRNHLYAQVQPRHSLYTLVELKMASFTWLEVTNVNYVSRVNGGQEFPSNHHVHTAKVILL
jgi:hypothetical protein